MATPTSPVEVITRRPNPLELQELHLNSFNEYADSLKWSRKNEPQENKRLCPTPPTGLTKT